MFNRLTVNSKGLRVNQLTFNDLTFNSKGLKVKS